MKTLICYFTGTGSSLFIARQLGVLINNSTIKNITYLIDNQIEEYDAIGFIYPNYYGNLPHSVKRVITNMNFNRDQYIFSIVSTAGNSGGSLYNLDNLLKLKGSRLNHGSYITLGTSNIVAPYYILGLLNEDRLKKRIDKTQENLKKIASDILHKRDNTYPVSFLTYYLAQFIYRLTNRENRRNIGQYFSSGESCSGCQICKKVCPVINIKFDSLKGPEWMNNCVDCCSCIQNCPNMAIEYKGKRVLKKRFKHPAISIVDLIEANNY